MTRILCLWMLGAAVLAAQDKSATSLTALQQTAEKRGTEWETLAQSLESKIARMLPCDARARAAVQEVSRVSDARLAALSQYLQAALTKAKQDTDAARRAIATQAAVTAELNLEKSETEIERAAIEAQLANLSASAKQRPALGDAQKKLASIAAMSRDRTAHAADLTATSDALTLSLREVDAAYQARQTALQNQLIAVGGESSRWGEYYAARLARAQTECSIVNQAPARAPQTQKKKQ